MDYDGLNLPGLVVEPLPSGNRRIRVRVKGDRTMRVPVPDGLSADDFMEAYLAAREGIATAYRPTSLGVMARKPGFWATIYHMLSRAKQRARRKGFAFDLSTDDIVSALEKQNGRCAVSGMQFDIRPHPRRGAKRPFCMSIDRLDNRCGYTVDNIRITTVIVNTALLDWKDDDFRRMCAAVSRTMTCPTVGSESPAMGHAPH